MVKFVQIYKKKENLKKIKVLKLYKKIYSKKKFTVKVVQIYQKHTKK